MSLGGGGDERDDGVSEVELVVASDELVIASDETARRTMTACVSDAARVRLTTR